MILKPPRGVRLNRSHAFARGMRRGYILNEAGGDSLHDHGYDGQDASFSGAGTVWEGGLHGPVVDTPLTEQIDVPNISYAADTEFTLACRVRIDAFTADMVVFGGADPFKIRSYGAWRISIASGVANIEWSEAFTVGQTYDLVLTRINEDLYAYVDGVYKATATKAQWDGQCDISTFLDDSGADGFDGAGSYFYAWDYALNADQVAALNRDPFQMFRHARTFFIMGQGGGGTPPITLTATTPEIVLDVPTASLALAGTLTATTPAVVLDVPSASLGLANVLAAGTVEVVLELPAPTLVAPIVLTATTPEIVLDLPAPTLSVGGEFSTFATDNFNRSQRSLDGDTMSDLTNTWALGLGGGWSIPASGDRATPDADNAPQVQYCDSMASTTKTQRATTKLLDVTGQVGVVVRFETANGYHYKAYRKASDQKGYVDRVDSGGTTALFNSGATTYAVDDTIGLEAQEDGTIRLYKNDVQVGADYDDSAGDGDVLEGHCGLYSNEILTEVDDFLVETVSVAPITLTATTPEIVLELPTATLVPGGISYSATTPELVLDIPSATLSAANVLAANTVEVLLELPGATLDAPIVLSATTLEVVVRTQAAILAGVNQTLTANVLSIVMAVPTASLAAAVLEYRIVLDIVGADPTLNLSDLNTSLELADIDPVLNVTHKEAT